MANYVPVGIATAYAYAKSKGYTGTEEEFAEYLANASTKAQQTVEKAGEAVQSARDAEASAVMADEITFGSDDPDSPYKDDNALKYKQEAEDARDDAIQAKDTILDMTVDAETVSPTTPASATYSDGNMHFGIPQGATFTPAVDSAGILSWSNDGAKTNPQTVNIAEAVRGVFDEIVTGTDPVITGVGNHRYLCSEVATISITPPVTGTIDVIFTSGTTPTVLTLPANVKMPDWFDIATLDTEKVYEINITDGVYGAVMMWAL